MTIVKVVNGKRRSRYRMTIIKAVNGKRRSRSKGFGKQKDRFGEKAKVLEEQMRAEPEPLGEGIRDQKFKYCEAALKYRDLTSHLDKWGFAEATKSLDFIISIERARIAGDRAKEAILRDSLRSWWASITDNEALEVSEAAADGGSDSSESSCCTFK